MIPSLIAKWMILWLLLPSSVAGGTPPQTSEQTRSPHGNLNIACQNCHTVYGWKPIRAVPEFDHNQTKFPLRGLHEGVNCVNCHTKMVFANVGNKCADCHADIHRGKLAGACENCHTVRGWKVSVTQINMHMNRFPLTGAHAAAACDDCHKSGALAAFNNMSTECISCHRSDFNGTANPKHTAATVFTTTPCQNCHSADSWANAKFDHSATGFLLSGGHSVPPRECAECHVNNNYNLGAMTCIQCHQTDYNNTTNPNHAQNSKVFVTTCDSCHTTVAWAPATINHSLTGFPLTGMHTVPPRTCDECHANNNYNLPATTCVGCHLNDFKTSTNPNHVTGGFPQTCETCHTTSAWQPANFDHSKTAFPLTGQHKVPPRQCADCHINSNYNITVTTCVSCHQTDYNNAKTPVDHLGGNFPTTCETCHDTTSWTDAKFDHASTGWPLTGNHTVPPRACSDCHTNGNYNITVTTCVSCHQNDYNTAKTPVDHVAANFPTTCETCHDTNLWTDGKFDHASTGWTLNGQHTVPPRSCTDCHVNGNYNITATNCVSCHQTDYNNTNNPNHASQGIPTTCEVCHTTSAWSPAQFDHSKSGFPLTGAHTVPPRACTDCHISNNYNITDTSCVSCHQADYNGAKTPVDHVSAKFPTACATCHDTVQWTDGKFDHSSTGWTLTNSHMVPPRTCVDCHGGGNYNITVTTCVSCHQTDYNNALTPVNHPQANFPTTCEGCHDTIAWTDGKFDHASTGWALTGSHTSPPRACTDCHVSGNYNIKTTTCVSCHQADYNGAKSPVDHVAAKFPTTCETCHDTNQWTDGVFNHSSTGWALTNAHTVPPRTCSDCHISGNYNITVTTCVSCHQTDYNNALTPVNHPQAGFPLTCETCHDTVQWTDGKFNHASTGWPLTNSHTVPPRACMDCHVSGNYNITVTTCVSCHQTDYNTAKSPVDHIAAKFPTACEGCHDTIAWTDGVFNHATTGWALTNAHTVPPRTCSDCHVSGNYNITVTTCVSCHQADYNGAKSPIDHVSANFPTTCDTCHDTIQWTDGKFDHSSTGFTLTGMHTVPPRACTDCHVGGNYTIKVTTCVSCHQTDYNTTNAPPHATAGFPTTCETCHDTVAWTDATFDHNKTAFPLTGSHTVPPRACVDCHVNNNYTTLPTDCYGCHANDYNSTNNPNHKAAQFPTTCATCHDTKVWTDATFNHTWFPMSHGNANGVCATCHTNPNDYSVFQCTGCHGNNNAANFHHPNVNGYVYNSINCYQCHKSGGGG